MKCKSYNKASYNVHRRILKRVDYFTNFVIRIIFRQLEQRATLKWGWRGVARNGASCLRVVTVPSLPYRSSYKQVAVLRRSSLHSLLKRNRKKILNIIRSFMNN